MVIGWLGDDPDTNKAVALVRRINNTLTESAWMSILLEPDADWRELEKLMSHELFEHVWFVIHLYRGTFQALLLC
jgi:hypothetical protein